MAITYRGETFDGYNAPKRTPKHPTKSHVVPAKEGDRVRMIRFGQQARDERQEMFHLLQRVADYAQAWEQQATQHQQP